MLQIQINTYNLWPATTLAHPCWGQASKSIPDFRKNEARPGLKDGGEGWGSGTGPDGPRADRYTLED